MRFQGRGLETASYAVQKRLASARQDVRRTALFEKRRSTPKTLCIRSTFTYISPVQIALQTQNPAVPYRKERFRVKHAPGTQEPYQTLWLEKLQPSNGLELKGPLETPSPKPEKPQNLLVHRRGPSLLAMSPSKSYHSLAKP